MLNRQEFISQLGKQAIELGVEVQTDDKIKSVNELDGDYIVDASGCPSLIKRELGFKKGIKGITFQQTLEDSNFFKSDTFKLFFGDSIGYYWIFPRNPEKKEINLGVGIIGNKKLKPKKMLESFKEEKGIEGKINYLTGGVIPVGLQKPLMYKNILFVGDAGVGTFPFTAEGIYRALLSGETAGRCIATGKAMQYPSQINTMFVRWDLIGRTFLYMGSIPQKMGNKVFLKSIKHFFEMVYFPLISKTK
jgi:flavin-dependent dehydrogenase